MSLINDALKKAQQQRAQDGSSAPPVIHPEQPAPSSGPTPAPAPSAKSPSRYAAVPPVTRYTPSKAPDKKKHPAAGKNRYATGATAAVVTLCIGITLYLLLSDSSQEDAPVAPTSADSTPNQIQPAPLPPPTLAINTIPHSQSTPEPASTPAEPAAPTSISLPSLSTPESAPATSATAATTLAPATLTPPAGRATPAAPVAAAATPNEGAPTPVPPPAAAAPAPGSAAPLPSIYTPRAPTAINPAARAQNFLDRLRVSGVRFTPTGGKVILNDRLFQETEIVDSALGLRLVKIEQGTLTFVDAQGRTYLKLFQ